MVLNLFYEEAESDRWFPWDRYPRRCVRRLIRGKPRIGGQQRVFLNLCTGLDRLGIDYRVNAYRHARKHPDELACIIGKPHVLDKRAWENPILFGAAVFSHPLSDQNLLKRLPVKRVLVPGEWMRKMWEPYYGGAVRAWPVGIDTDHWCPSPVEPKTTDFLLYDKIRWEHDRYEAELLAPIRKELLRRGLTLAEIRYGFYKEEDYRASLVTCKGMVFLCEHETQGIAYQQALSSGVPILAWDRGGFWQDPEFYPHKVKFEPVSSVPYWDERCGIKFTNLTEFPTKLQQFLERNDRDGFHPRDYVLDTLSLRACAQAYLNHYQHAETDCK